MKLTGFLLTLCLSLRLSAQFYVPEYIPFFVFPGDSMEGISTWILVDGGLLGDSLPGEATVFLQPATGGEIDIYATMPVLGRNSRGEILLIADTATKTAQPDERYFTMLDILLPPARNKHWLLSQLTTGMIYMDNAGQLLAGYEILPYRNYPGINDTLNLRLFRLLGSDMEENGNLAVSRGWFSGQALSDALRQMDTGLWELYAMDREEKATLGMEVIFLPEDLSRWIMQGTPAPSGAWLRYLLGLRNPKTISHHPGVANHILFSEILDILETGKKEENLFPVRELADEVVKALEKNRMVTKTYVQRAKSYLKVLASAHEEKNIKALLKIMAANEDPKGTDDLAARATLLLMDIYNRNGDPAEVISLASGMPVANIFLYTHVNMNDILLLETAADIATENGYYEEALKFYERANDHLEMQPGNRHTERRAYNCGLIITIAAKTGKAWMVKDYQEKQMELLETEE